MMKRLFGSCLTQHEKRFDGVSLAPCPGNTFRIRYDTVIRCDCRTYINLSKAGIYKIYSQRGPPTASTTYESYGQRDVVAINYVRVFPARARPGLQKDGLKFIELDGQRYAHGDGLDLIVTHAEHIFQVNAGDDINL